jgi:lysophospholipase L1-like esterase
VLTVAAGCGQPTAPSPTSISAPRLSRSRLLAFGDSATAGEVTAPSMSASGGLHPQVVVAEASYPAVLGSQLTSRYASQSPAVVVVNAGRSGEHVVDALPRFIDTYERERPDVVLLLDGYNDLLTRGQNAVDGAAAALTAIAVEARNRGARVFIATVTPNRPDRQRTISASILLAYNDRIRAVAAAERLVLVDLYAAFLPAVDSYIGVDGLHPTEVGYRRMAETFFTAIVSELETR